jgi:hypothetical protein
MRRQTTCHCDSHPLSPASIHGRRPSAVSSCIAAPSLVFDDALPAPQPATALHALHGLAHWQVINHAPRMTRTKLTCRLAGQQLVSFFLPYAAMPHCLSFWVRYRAHRMVCRSKLAGHTARVCRHSVELAMQVGPAECPSGTIELPAALRTTHHAPCTMHRFTVSCTAGI